MGHPVSIAKIMVPAVPSGPRDRRLIGFSRNRWKRTGWAFVTTDDDEIKEVQKGNVPEQSGVVLW